MSPHVAACPECGSISDDRAWVEWCGSHVEVVYTCDECLIEFVTALEPADKEVTQRHEG